MKKLLNIFTTLHKSTKRDYITRMVDDKINCMKVARKFDKNFWDGDRKYGYGGYSYDGRWEKVARKLINYYQLPLNSKILDVGCGKGYLLYEFKKLLPHSEIHGFDISQYAIDNSKKEIKNNIRYHNAKDKYPYNNNYFDLVISITTLHNLPIYHLKKSIEEIERVGEKKYIVVESYRDEEELFNLQCWALTCESFFSEKEWNWLFNEFNYTGDYEFIYF